MKITVEFESLEEFQNYRGVSGQSAPVKAVPVQAVAPIPVNPSTPAVTPVGTVAPAAPTQTTVTPPAEAIPTTAPSYSADDLAKACIVLMDQGRQKDLQNLLAQFGVTALPQLMKEQYGAFATALRGMGAPI